MKWLIKSIHQSHKRKRGFTLIELMVVVIVVGILAAAAIPIYRFAMSRAYSSEAKATMGTLMSSMKVYYAENDNDYPAFVWGMSDEILEADDIMSILGVDTDTNNWWHCGFEGYGAARDAADPTTCSFGTVILSAWATIPVISIAAPLGATGPYVWAVGIADPITDIEVVYDMGTDTWHYAY